MTIQAGLSEACNAFVNWFPVHAAETISTRLILSHVLTKAIFGSRRSWRYEGPEQPNQELLFSHTIPIYPASVRISTACSRSVTTMMVLPAVLLPFSDSAFGRVGQIVFCHRITLLGCCSNPSTCLFELLTRIPRRPSVRKVRQHVAQIPGKIPPNAGTRV